MSDSARPYHLVAAENHWSSLKEKACRELVQAIRARDWTQSQAAGYLEVSQPRLSDLMRGKTEKFSLDVLVKMAFALDLSVRLVLADEPYRRSRGRNDESWLREARASVEHYTQLLEGDPDNPLLLSRRALAYQLLEDWTRALADYDRCIQLEPERPGPYLNRATALRGAGRLHDALQACHDYERRFPEDSVHQNRALVYWDLGLLVEAERDLDAAVALSPQRPGPWTNRANFYKQQGRLPEALGDYLRAQQLDPTSDSIAASIHELQQLGTLPPN